MKKWWFRKLKLISKVVFAALMWSVFAYPAMAYEDGDFQYWNANEIEWKAKADWKVSVGEELRWGGNASQMYYQHSDIGLSYSGMADWFDIKAGYRQVFNKGKKSWTYENIPNLNGTLKFDLFGFKFSDRNRLEFRDIENKKDNWRYRNLLKAKIPMTIGKVKVEPYVADETFFDLSRHCEFNRNRMYSGLEFVIFGGFTVDLHYILQTTKGSGRWTDYNILGSKIKLAF